MSYFFETLYFGTNFKSFSTLYSGWREYFYDPTYLVLYRLSSPPPAPEAINSIRTAAAASCAVQQQRTRHDAAGSFDPCSLGWVGYIARALARASPTVTCYGLMGLPRPTAGVLASTTTICYCTVHIYCKPHGRNSTRRRSPISKVHTVPPFSWYVQIIVLVLLSTKTAGAPSRTAWPCTAAPHHHAPAPPAAAEHGVAFSSPRFF